MSKLKQKVSAHPKIQIKSSYVSKEVLETHDTDQTLPSDLKEFGVDCIYISGHGGRQIDSIPPPILQLRKIRNVSR